MSQRRSNEKSITLAVATLAPILLLATLPTTSIRYTSLDFLLIWSLPGIVSSFVIYLYFNLRKTDIIGLFVIGYMLATTFQFVFDILVNNYSHSNLSLSLLISMAVGAGSGWAGTTLWNLLRRRSASPKKPVRKKRGKSASK